MRLHRRMRPAINKVSQCCTRHQRLPAMTECLLKFQIPRGQYAAVRRAVVTAATPERRLRLLYADTPSRKLAAHGLTLHLRHEGRAWTQLLSFASAKVPGLEHEVRVCAMGRRVPSIDVQRHAGTALADMLTKATGKDGEALAMGFEVQVDRLRRTLRSGASQVQVTLDQGELQVGEACLPICEVTFERLSGPAPDAVALMARWIERYGLWFDTRTWSAMADELSATATPVDAVQAAASPLSAKLTPNAALRALIFNCLEHLLPNATHVAAGSSTAEHLHQTRVAMRRLRTVLRVFGGWSPALEPHWGEVLAEVFGRLGATRDQDAMAAVLLPELIAAGAPSVDLAQHADVEAPSQVLRSPACNRVLLELLCFAGEPPFEKGPHDAIGHAASGGPKLKALAAPMLNRMHRQIVRDATVFLTLDDPARHRTRRRLKRLRYSAEFTAPLFPAKAVKRYLAPMRAAQEALGTFNDLTVAEQAFHAQVEHDARAWFAVGWLAARRGELLRDCAKALGQLSRAHRFWKT